MATATNAFFLVNPKDSLQDGGVSIGAMHPETQPAFIWGQGSPAGTLAPWTKVNKGSLWFQVNGTDDEGHAWMKVDEGDDAADWVKVLTSPYNAAQTYVDTELRAVDIAQTATHISGSTMVALNVAQTIAGTAGTWSSAVFAKVTQGASAAGVSGYVSAAEFETNMDQTSGTPQWYVLSLNANGDEASGLRHAKSAYVALWDYGDVKLGNLFHFASLGVVPATASTTAIVSKLGAGKETTCDAAVKFDVAGVPYWFLCSTTAPA